MAFPTTLALITALWSGPARTRSIALWSALGGAISALGPLLAGALLEHFWWGSVFLITLPLALVALPLAVRLVPSHVNETSDPVDNLGGMLSALLVAGIVLAINLAPVPDAGTIAIGLALIALAAGVAFVIRQRRAKPPLYDLDIAARRDLLGRRRRRHHRVRVAHGRDVHRPAVPPERARVRHARGRSLDPPGGGAAWSSSPHDRRSSSRRAARGSRCSSATFSACSASSRCWSLWKEGIPYWKVGLAYGFVGIGVGFAGTPASHSLTGSVPVERAGMASGTADLQRDLGGAIMQSILGALLTAGYAAAFASAIAGAPNGSQVSDNVEAELTKSFSSAANTAQQYPQYSKQIIAAAKTSFIDGADWAYAAGIIAILLGAALVFFFFPKMRREKELLQEYHDTDVAAHAAAVAKAG